MECTLFLGFDAHKNSIVATVVDGEGTTLDPTQLGSGDSELKGYLDWLPGRADVVLEPCSVCSTPVSKSSPFRSASKPGK